MIQLNKLISINEFSITAEYHEYWDNKKKILTVNLQPVISKIDDVSVFSEVKKVNYFKKAFVDPISKALTRPNGFDLCSDSLLIWSKK